MTAFFHHRELNGNMIAVWALVLVFPLLLASELSQRWNTSTHIPDHYRSSYSDQVSKSSKWREPTTKEPDWRKPASPQIEWRSGVDRAPSQSFEDRNADLYPNYSPGGSSTFDSSMSEDRSGIKLFGF